MAYRIISRVNTDEVRGTTKLVKVREFGVISLPSETYFQFRRDATQPCYASPGTCAKQFSDRIEAVLASPDVVDVDYFQDTRAGGRLVDMMRTFYETPDGALSGSVESTLAEFGPGHTLDQVAAAIGADSGEIERSTGGPVAVQ